MDNICCGDGRDLNIGSVTNLYVSCCCKCGNNGGEDKPEPPIPEKSRIYGIRIDKNNPDPSQRIEYTHDAVGMKPAFMNFETGVFDYGDWKDVWFVKENKPVMLNYDGTEAYELNPEDYSKRSDGTPSDVANTEFPGNAMAVIPLVWLKCWEDAQYEYYNFAADQVDEAYHAYAHTRADGTIMDKRYMRMFGGSLVNGKLRSLSGQSLMHSKTSMEEIAYAQANNLTGESIWYTGSWSEWNLISLLCIMLGKSDNSQAVFGSGNNNGGSTATSLMATGILNEHGQFFGYNNSSKQVKVCHIEKPWGGQWERIAGCIYTQNGIKIKETPPYNINGSGYFDTGVVMNDIICGYINKTKAIEYGRIPLSMNGTGSTYTCDGGWCDNSQVNYALRGGGNTSDDRCGITCIGFSAPALSSLWCYGAGLSCEQPKTA